MKGIIKVGWQNMLLCALRFSFDDDVKLLTLRYAVYN